jgi:hypothetical protein
MPSSARVLYGRLKSLGTPSTNPFPQNLAYYNLKNELKQPMPNLAATLNKVGVFSRGMWRYWRFNEPAPADSNYVVQKLYAFTDGRSNDILFRLLESKRLENHSNLNFGWNAKSIVSPQGASDPGIDQAVRALKEDGIAVLPLRLKPETIENFLALATTCSSKAPYKTMTFAPAGNHAPGTQETTPRAETGTSDALDLTHPRHSYYEVPRDLLLENQNMQRLLCDPYLLTVAARYLGVFPVVTKPSLWWDTDFVPPGLRPRPFHVDSGCLRWLKVGINLTDTTLDTPHFVYVKGSHNPNKATRPLTRRLASRMNLSVQEVMDVCPDKVIPITGPAGSITLADTRGIHKGELAARGHRLVLYFGLEGSAFNNIDDPLPLHSVGSELSQAMTARPFSYQFFRKAS